MLDLHTWQFSFVKRRGTPLPLGNMVPRSGCFDPRGSKRLDGGAALWRSVARHMDKARGLSIGALLGAWHPPLAQRMSARVKPANCRFPHPDARRDSGRRLRTAKGGLIGHDPDARKAGNDRDASDAGLQRCRSSVEGFAGAMPTGSAAIVLRVRLRGKAAASGAGDCHGQSQFLTAVCAWRKSAAPRPRLWLQ